MKAETCPEHAALWPGVWNPPGAPCPFEGCPNGTRANMIVDADGNIYSRSRDMLPACWIRHDYTIALDTRTEGT